MVSATSSAAAVVAMMQRTRRIETSEGAPLFFGDGGAIFMRVSLSIIRGFPTLRATNKSSGFQLFLKTRDLQYRLWPKEGFVWLGRSILATKCGYLYGRTEFPWAGGRARARARRKRVD